jgi:hypothetical protein
MAVKNVIQWSILDNPSAVGVVSPAKNGKGKTVQEAEGKKGTMWASSLTGD